MKHTKTISTLIFLILSISSYGQVEKRKNYFPIWTFHQQNINIHGMSIGLLSFNDEPRYTNTNGIKLELIGMGILIPLIPSSPIVENDSAFIKLAQEPLSEKINGLNLSATGSVCHCLTNGLTAGFIGQIHHQVNGISTSLLMSFTQKHNGIMMAMFNDAYYMKGLQIGLVNNGYNLKGLQIGLWNVNQRRKLPLINWNF
jgi:hypothetical protein